MFADLPGVGRNLQDHIGAYGLTWTTSKPGSAYNPFLYTANPSTYWKWKAYKTGPLAAPLGLEANAFVSTTDSNDRLARDWPDVQINFMSSHPGFDGGTTYKDFLGISDDLYRSYFAKNSFREGFSLYPVLMRPKSRGYIQLRSGDPFDPPKIQPNYLSEREDVYALARGGY